MSPLEVFCINLDSVHAPERTLRVLSPSDDTMIAVEYSARWRPFRNGSTTAHLLEAARTNGAAYVLFQFADGWDIAHGQ
jgi:hypothetical protein